MYRGTNTDDYSDQLGQGAARHRGTAEAEADEDYNEAENLEDDDFVDQDCSDGGAVESRPD